MLFVTDTAYLQHAVKHAHYAMIECNYQLDKLNSSADSSRLELSARNRILSSHMGLDMTLKILKGLNQDILKEIHILHLSSRHTDEAEIKKTIERELGKPVFMAKA